MRSIDWPHKLKMKTGLMLSASEQEDWTDELFTEVRNLTDHEICKAISWAFGSKENTKRFKKKSKYDYTQPILRMWIYMHRRETSVPATAGIEARHAIYMQDLKRQLDNAQDHDHRWRIICWPGSADDCAELEEYTLSKWPDFRRPGVPDGVPF